jgi:hypothetical protein
VKDTAGLKTLKLFQQIGWLPDRFRAIQGAAVVRLYGPIIAANFMKHSIDYISQKSQDSTHTPVVSNVLNAEQSYSDEPGDQNSTGDATYSTVVADVDKLLFIAYREKLLRVCCLEHEYEWCWFAHFYRITNPSADLDEELTFPMIFDEDLERSRYIECLLARETLDDAIECALRC